MIIQVTARWCKINHIKSIFFKIKRREYLLSHSGNIFTFMFINYEFLQLLKGIVIEQMTARCRIKTTNEVAS